MEVRFVSRKLELCYRSHDRAAREWGSTVGRKYIQRIKIVQSARTLQDLYSIKSLDLHPLKGKRHGELGLILHDRWRLGIVCLEENVVRVEEVTKHYGD